MTSTRTNDKRAPVSAHFRSTAYGLTIRSDFDLPEFFRATGPTDVEVILDRPCPASECDTTEWLFERNNVVCRFAHVGKFRVTGGTEIRTTPVVGVEPAFLRLYVEGMMMAIVLHQRGRYVLHSSVVKIGNVGAAFVGTVGAGKSSTAMALHARGHMVVTDDNAAILAPLTTPQVIPAFPRIKLYPAIARSLGLTDSSLQDLHSSQVKKTRSVADNFPVDPVPLHRIYCLTRGGPEAITKLSLPEALIELVKVSVPGRWGIAGDARHLRETAELAKTLPVYRIRTFDSLESLPLLADRIEEHCRIHPANVPALEQRVLSHAG